MQVLHFDGCIGSCGMLFVSCLIGICFMTECSGLVGCIGFLCLAYDAKYFVSTYAVSRFTCPCIMLGGNCDVFIGYVLKLVGILRSVNVIFCPM